MTVSDAARDAAARVTDRALTWVDWDAIGLPGSGMLASPRDACAQAVYNTVLNLRPEDVPDLVAAVWAADPLRARIEARVDEYERAVIRYAARLDNVSDLADLLSDLRADLDATADTTRTDK